MKGDGVRLLSRVLHRGRGSRPSASDRRTLDRRAFDRGALDRRTFDRGASAVEQALLATGVAGAVMVSLVALGQALRSDLECVAHSLLSGGSVSCADGSSPTTLPPGDDPSATAPTSAGTSPSVTSSTAPNPGPGDPTGGPGGPGGPGTTGSTGSTGTAATAAPTTTRTTTSPPTTITSTTGPPTPTDPPTTP